MVAPGFTRAIAAFPWDAARLHAQIAGDAELMLLPDGNHGCANVTFKHRGYGADWMARVLADAAATSAGGAVEPLTFSSGDR